MLTDKLDFDKIMRRGDKVTHGSKTPTELFQCAVFFSRPILDEVEELEDISNFNFKFLNKKKILNLEEKLSKQRFVFPFYSKEVFTVATDAENFLGNFIRRLIKEEKLPLEVVNEDKTVNEELLQLAVIPLNVTFLEKEKPEFK